MSLKIPEIISEEELIKVIKKKCKPHHKIAFLLGFYGCLRVSEIVKLRKEDINKETKIIRVKQGKGSKDRNIPLPPQIVRGIKYIPLKCGIRALEIAWKSKSKRVLKKNTHFHTLRHSGATYYLNIKKWSTRQVQQLLGHSRIQTTEIYTHVTPQDLIDRMWEK